MKNIGEVPRGDTSTSVVDQGLWYAHYRLFSLALALYAVYCTYSWGWTVSLFLALGYLAWVVYTSLPEMRQNGAENYSAIIIGAGGAGIAAGIKLNQIGVKYVVLEKAHILSGTWWENIYPGCASDIASHFFCFSFFPNPWWTETHSKQAEIKTYLEDVASYYRIYPKIQFNTQVLTNEWNDETKLYTVTCEGGKQYTANFVISGCGALHKPKIPDFKGMNDFQGHLFHSAKWDASVDITNKRVALIGTGASSVQILPNIANKVKSVHVFQRSPAWVTPRGEGEYKTITKWIFALFPFTMTIHRYYWFWKGELFYYQCFWRTRKYFTESFMNNLKTNWYSQVEDPEVREKLIPKYELGCKRWTPSDSYLKIHSQYIEYKRFNRQGNSRACYRLGLKHGRIVAFYNVVGANGLVEERNKEKEMN